MIMLPILTTSLTHLSLNGWENGLLNFGVTGLAKYTLFFVQYMRHRCQCFCFSFSLPRKRDKPTIFTSFTAASPEILHHTVWRTWLFIVYSYERWLYYQFSLPHLYIFSVNGWENVLFELGSVVIVSTAGSTLWLVFTRELSRRKDKHKIRVLTSGTNTSISRTSSQVTQATHARE